MTGLGSPNFELIANLVINNQSSFPNLGAYPSGVSQTVLESGSDDDAVDTRSKAAFGLAIGGVVFGLCAIGLIVYFLFGKRKEEEPLLKQTIV